VENESDLQHEKAKKAMLELKEYFDKKAPIYSNMIDGFIKAIDGTFIILKLANRI
jgi:hypothetical protein